MSRAAARSAAPPTRAGSCLAAALAAGVVIALVFLPDLAFEAALYGLKIWWEVVFPALLPFFVGAEILMGLGVVHAMGVLLEPLMRPLFNVPGAGSFVLAMGLASGYPIGSILTSRMRREKLVSRPEGERLMSFCNTADPLFMSGAVAVGMFADVRLAGVIMAAHYLSALGVGLGLRFYQARGERTPAVAGGSGDRPLPLRALDALYEARVKDARALGQLMGDAIRSSVNTLLLIGGFIILFSVIIRMLIRVGAVGWLAGLFLKLAGPLGLERPAAEALVAGLFEITIGTQMASQAAVPLLQRVAVASAIIAWSGLSVQAQVASIIQGTDLSIRPYVVARLAHGVLAAAWTVVLWEPLGHAAAGGAGLVRAVTAMAGLDPAPVPWLVRLASSARMAAWLVLPGLALFLVARLRGPFR